ncbi:MAG: DUF3179 domain-containing protein [bacterium]|nr:DUF3179 domain-containing protein [Acidimicrobiia bacterium]MCY4651322.1 DUF3179 domain-containing protein [bacterium]
MSTSPSWLIAAVLGSVLLMFATACGEGDTAAGSPTSAAPTDDPATTAPATTATPETTPTEDPSPQDATDPTTSTTLAPESAVEISQGCPPPPDTPPITRPLSENNPHTPPSHLEDAAALWPTDWSRTTIDLEELSLGIRARDPRDLIPPIDRPVFVDVGVAQEWLSDRDPGMLVRVDDHARFYPLRVLTRHEIVNDRFGDRPVTVTYCPLCNTAVAFDPVVNGTHLRFGVSGLLRNSDLVMWDLETTSLWQQITGEPLVGTYAGESPLAYVPSAIVAFSEFAESNPGGCVLGPDQAFGISYGTNPYVGYSSSARPFLYSGDLDDRLPALSRVVGVNINNENKAYSFGDLEAVRVINDTLDSVPIVVLWGAAHTADALDRSSMPDSQAIGTAVAYIATTGERALTFTASGEDLFTDAQTNSTWNLLGEAIDGPLTGTQLEFAPHRNEFWFAWFAFFGATGELWEAS